jgi:CRP/FNR family cyclic AMP-dependent transcriptional regulator
MLFVEGQPARGVYMLCHGAVKLQTSSRDGKVVILHVARPGELIGLSAIVSGDVYEVSAEVIEPCRVNYISRSDFFRLMQTYPDIAMSTVQQLAARYVDTCNQIRSIVLANCVADKLAGLLLDWSTIALSAKDGDGPIRLKMRFTHEEIGEMIGTSRETVTRLLKDFRERDLISLKGSDLYIHSKKGLEMTIGRPRASRTRM